MPVKTQQSSAKDGVDFKVQDTAARKDVNKVLVNIGNMGGGVI